MKKAKGFASVLVASAVLSFVGFLAYLILIALVVSIFHVEATESAINWAFVYIPLIAAVISFFVIRKPNEWKNADDSLSLDLCAPLWMISVPIASFIISRSYGSLEYFATTADLNFVDLLYICIICFVFTLVISLIIAKIIKAKQQADEREKQQKLNAAEKQRQEAEEHRKNEINRILTQMKSMDVYSIDIIPFLNALNSSGKTSTNALNQTIKKTSSKVTELEAEINRLNKLAEQLQIPNRTRIHYL